MTETRENFRSHPLPPPEDNDDLKRASRNLYVASSIWCVLVGTSSSLEGVSISGTNLVSFDYPSLIYVLLFIGWWFAVLRWFQVSHDERSQLLLYLGRTSLLNPESKAQQSASYIGSRIYRELKPIMVEYATLEGHRDAGMIDLSTRVEDMRPLIEGAQISTSWTIKDNLGFRGTVHVVIRRAKLNLVGGPSVGRCVDLWLRLIINSDSDQATRVERNLVASLPLTWKEFFGLVLSRPEFTTLYGPPTWAVLALILSIAWPIWFGPAVPSLFNAIKLYLLLL